MATKALNAHRQALLWDELQQRIGGRADYDIISLIDSVAQKAARIMRVDYARVVAYLRNRYDNPEE